MKKIRYWFRLRLVERRYRLLLKQIGVRVCFKTSHPSGDRIINKRKIIRETELFHLVKDYIFFQPLRHITQIDYYLMVHQEIVDLAEILDFSKKLKKRFLNFSKTLVSLKSFNYRNFLIPPKM